VIADGQRGRGAESMLAKILLEAAKEDLDGTCLRRDGDECSEVIKKATKGEILRIAAVKSAPDGWVPIKLSEKGDIAWVSHDGVDLAGDGSQCSVHGEYMKPESIRRTLAEARKLAPELGATADQIDGELWIRDAIAKKDQGMYAAAYASFAEARKLVPSDERLGQATKCWILANGFLLLIFAGVIVVAASSVVMILKTRVKRVRVAEFKYYGKDRVRVEREIDGASAVGGAEGGAPAPAPAEEPPAATPQG
jgi:hypothetical protein